MENVGIFYDHSEYFTAIWYNLWPCGIGSLWPFGMSFPIWYVGTKKNLATLMYSGLMNRFFLVTFRCVVTSIKS
jgi:hypothetical protein